MHPFDVNETSFEHVYEHLEGEDIIGMTIHINTPADGYFIDTEIQNLSPPMRKQMFNQLSSLISTYKRLMGLI
jgi:hypothetical protein